MKKINNKYIFVLIVFIFILSTILFKSINKTFAQFMLPERKPSEGTGSNIIVNPLKEDLNLGGYSVIGEGNIDINGNINSNFNTIGDLNLSGDLSIGGNVGIGPTTVRNKLHLTSSNSASALQFNTPGYNETNTWGSRIFTQDGYGGLGYSGIPLAVEIQYGDDWYSSSYFSHGQIPTHPSLRTYSHTYLATDGGDVGIGTTDASAKLHAIGNKMLITPGTSENYDYPASWGKFATIGDTLDDSYSRPIGLYGLDVAWSSDWVMLGMIDDGGSNEKDAALVWGDDAGDDLLFKNCVGGTCNDEMIITSAGDLEVSGSVKIGNTSSTCDESVVGTLKYINQGLYLCLYDENLSSPQYNWKRIISGEAGTDNSPPPNNPT